MESSKKAKSFSEREINDFLADKLVKVSFLFDFDLNSENDLHQRNGKLLCEDMAELLKHNTGLIERAVRTYGHASADSPENTTSEAINPYEKLPYQPHPYLEVAYREVIASRTNVEHVHTVQDKFRNEVFKYYNASEIGESSSEVGYCVIKEAQDNQDEDFPASEAKMRFEVSPRSDITIRELKPGKVDTFDIIPVCLDGEELSHLFGGSKRLLPNLQNVLPIHPDIGQLLYTGAAVIVPITPIKPEIQTRWKFVLTWKPSQVKVWNGVPQRRAFEDLEGRELTFRGFNRPAARFLYFRFMLTYTYWLRKEGSGKAPSGLDWAKELEKDGHLWAAPGPYVRRNCFEILTSMLAGRALQPDVYENCTFLSQETLPLNISEEEETKYAENLYKKIEALFERWEPEQLNSYKDKRVTFDANETFPQSSHFRGVKENDPLRGRPKVGRSYSELLEESKGKSRPAF